MAKCALCHEIVSDAEAYTAHLNSAHLIAGSGSCQLCRMHVGVNQLNRHELTYQHQARLKHYVTRLFPKEADRGANAGRVWSKDDMTALWSMSAAAESWDVIGTVLKRPARAVRRKWLQLIKNETLSAQQSGASTSICSASTESKEGSADAKPVLEDDDNIKDDETIDYYHIPASSADGNDDGTNTQESKAPTKTAQGSKTQSKETRANMPKRPRSNLENPDATTLPKRPRTTVAPTAAVPTPMPAPAVLPTAPPTPLPLNKSKRSDPPTSAKSDKSVSSSTTSGLSAAELAKRLEDVKKKMLQAECKRELLVLWHDVKKEVDAQAKIEQLTAELVRVQAQAAELASLCGRTVDRELVQLDQQIDRVLVKREQPTS